MEEADGPPSAVMENYFRPEITVFSFLAFNHAMDSMLTPCIDILDVTLYCSVGTTGVYVSRG